MCPHDRAAGTIFAESSSFPRNIWFLIPPAYALWKRDKTDGAKAMTLLDQSLAISSQLGMRPLMERVLSRGEILED